MNDEEAERELLQVVLKLEPLVYRDEQVELPLNEAQQYMILIPIPPNIEGSYYLVTGK
jgi:hypothetical protein